MFTTISHLFNVLVLLDVSLAILCCILLIKLPVKYAIKYVTIPIVLFITYILVVHGDDMLGRPYDSMPQGKFEFKDYRVVEYDGKKKIELWVLQNKKSRLHVIDYSEMTEQKLAKSKSQGRKGVRQQGEFKEGKMLGKGEESLSIGDIPLQGVLPPKDEQ